MNYNSSSYRNSSNYSISNSMINIESDNNSNSNSNDSTNDTAMIPTIETTVSAVPTMMDIEILTNITLSLKVPVIFFIIKLIDVYESVTYIIVLIEIPNDMSNFIDIVSALLIIIVSVAQEFLVANELNRDFESISMSKEIKTVGKLIFFFFESKMFLIKK